MSRIAPHPDAFALRHKQPRVKRATHLAFIRKLPCLIAGTAPSEAAHVRFGSSAHMKRETGLQEKPSDCWVVPLSADMHRLHAEAQHNANEREWWSGHGIDPHLVAMRLFACMGNEDEARRFCLGVKAKRYARVQPEGTNR